MIEVRCVRSWRHHSPGPDCARVPLLLIPSRYNPRQSNITASPLAVCRGRQFWPASTQGSGSCWGRDAEQFCPPGACSNCEARSLALAVWLAPPEQTSVAYVTSHLYFSLFEIKMETCLPELFIESQISKEQGFL